MRHLPKLFFLQVILCVLALFQKYRFLHEICKYFPCMDVIYILISLALWIIVIIGIVHSIKNKNRKWIYTFVCIPLLMLIVNEMEKQEEEREKNIYSYSVSFSIPNSSDKYDTYGINLLLDKNRYTLISHIGEEGGCTNEGTFSFRNDTLFFDRELNEMSSGLISGNFIALGDYRVQRDESDVKAFGLERKNKN
jgi:hypothetical protein